MSILDIPDDIIVKIESFSTSYSLSDYLNIRLVSKKFCFLYEDINVVSKLFLRELDFFPNWNAPHYYYNQYWRLQLAGNPDAMFRVGVVSYFHDINAQNNGFMLMNQAADEGNEDDVYLIGIMLICRLGGTIILSSLFKPSISHTLEFLESHRMQARQLLAGRGEFQLITIKKFYFKDECRCNGETIRILLENCTYFDPYGRLNDMDIDKACKSCICHHEVELFLERIPNDHGLY